MMFVMSFYWLEYDIEGSIMIVIFLLLLIEYFVCGFLLLYVCNIGYKRNVSKKLIIVRRLLFALRI